MSATENRGMDYLESLINNGSIKIIGQDIFLKNYESFVGRVIKFDDKTNIVKWAEKRAPDGTITMPENEVEHLRVFFHVQSQTVFDKDSSGFVTKTIDKAASFNFKMTAITPLATLSKKLGDESGDKTEICNWNLEIKRVDITGKSGYDFQAFKVVQLKRVGMKEGEADGLSYDDHTEPVKSEPAKSAPEKPAEPAPSFGDGMDKFKSAIRSSVKNTSDVVPFLLDYLKPLKTPEEKRPFSQAMAEWALTLAKKEIGGSTNPVHTSDTLIAGPLAKIISIHDPMREYANTQAAMLSDDIPF